VRFVFVEFRNAGHLRSVLTSIATLLNLATMFIKQMEEVRWMALLTLGREANEISLAANVGNMTTH